MLSNLTARELRDQIASGKVSAVEATKFSLDAIDRLNPQLNAYNSVERDHALAQAAAIDKKRAAGESLGLLGGVPMALKDNMCTDYGTTTCSSKMLQNFKAPFTATVVKKLEAAGAVILGKTNLDEFAMGSSTENSAFGPSKNPWNPKYVPGGSSGGSASALSSRMCFAALGTDTGGSIRQPASFCGVVGMKPTYGLVSRYGVVAFASSLDQVGPMAFTVEDAALLLDVIAGHDPKDSTSWPKPLPHYTAEIEKPMENIRVGLPKEFFDVKGTDPEITTHIQKAIDWYKSQGATLVDIDLPHMQYGIAAYYIIAPAEASSNLAKFDGVHYGHRTAKPEDLFDLYAASRAEGFGPEVRRRLMLGTYALSSGYYDAYYNRALKIRRLIKEDFTKAFQKCDVILGPTSPSTAFEIGSKKDLLELYLCDVFTVTCNIAGIAGMSLPCGFSSKNLPIGLQLIGPEFSEAKLLRIARQYEKAHDWSNRKPPVA